MGEIGGEVKGPNVGRRTEGGMVSWRDLAERAERGVQSQA